MLKKRSRYMLQTYGGETLKQKSETVTVFDQDLNDLARDMIKANRVLNGIGLAAVQLGIHKRLVVLDIPRSSMSEPPTPGELQLLPQMPVVLVNPRIVEYNKEIVPYDEGCLSVPNLYAEVLRPSMIKVVAQDLSGAEFEFECGGLLARCIQHEVDHLDGLLFVDRLTEEVAAAVASDFSAMKRRGKKFDFAKDVKI